MLKAIFLTLTFALSANAADMASLMKRPMVTGASISAGQDGISFAEVLAKKYNVQKALLRDAHSGQSGTAILKNFKKVHEDFKLASLVLALDFFYWDQKLCKKDNGAELIAEAMDQLFSETVKQGVPLVLGKLVQGKPPFEKIHFDFACGNIINQKMKEKCDLDPKHCLIIDLGKSFDELKQKYLLKVSAMSEAERTQYVKENITKDGVHPRTGAYEVIAEGLEYSLKRSPLEARTIESK